MYGRSLDHSRLAFVSGNPPTVSQKTNLKRSSSWQLVAARGSACTRTAQRPSISRQPRIVDCIVGGEIDLGLRASLVCGPAGLDLSRALQLAHCNVTWLLLTGGRREYIQSLAHTQQNEAALGIHTAS